MQASGHEGDRVHQGSTDEQIRTGVSLAVQQAKIEAYAMIKDWALVDVIRGEGAGAKSLRRPGVQRLRLVHMGAVAGKRPPS